ncbi:MAG: CocE/NonD family hydrolase [SAR202 cluster bacterium]|nr:CocE/NonD family hydrolase [SAR202 cluster bacterium]
MPSLYQGSQIQYDVTYMLNVMMPMRDGVRLAADIYFPSVNGKPAPGKFPVLLERTPYDKGLAKLISNGKYFARRGYVVVNQDVRGRYESEGEWYAFAREAPDGFDTVEWLAKQPWSNGKVGTMGGSYAGSDQCALATLNPPHLSTMIVEVGASNYYHSSMRQNGALEQRFLIYAFRMAVTSKEAKADPDLRRELIKAFTKDMPDIVNSFPLRQGQTVLRRLPLYEQWAIDVQNHADYDDYWKQRGYAIDEYYEEHADVPTLYLGGWYDSYARNTPDSYMKLSRMKKSRQVLLMGPWVHGFYEITYSGDVDFGMNAHISQRDMRLAWYDHFMKGMDTEVAGWKPVHIFTMGTGTQTVNKNDYENRLDHGGYWRQEPDWPLPGTKLTQYYIHPDGTLSTKKPAKAEAATTNYTFNPRNPVPTMGGGISAADQVIRPGAFDQRGRPDFFGMKDKLPLNMRPDVLSYQTPELEEDTEVTGPITMHLWASSSAVDTDFTAKLLDIHPPSADYPDGLAINVTDSIIRARYRNGWDKPELMKPGTPYEFVFELYPTSNIFRKGHRIRLDISSSNWPRFDVNPNTGGPIGLERAYLSAQQTVYHEPARPTHVVLPMQPGRVDRAK